MPDSIAPVVSDPSPASEPAANAIPTVESAPVAPASQPQASESLSAGQGNAPVPAVDPRAEITALATDLGFDPAVLDRFQDVNSARAAVQFMVEQTARAGLAESANTPAPVVPATPAVPPVSEAEAIDLASLGIDPEDPAAKAIRILEAKLAAVGGVSSKIEQQFKAIEEQRQQAEISALKTQVEETVDSFASERYGTSKHRTPGQQVALMQLYDMADAILIGAHRAGRPLPTPAARLRQARMILETGPTAPAAGAPVLAPQSPAPAGESEPVSMLDNWSEHPYFRQKLNLV